VLIAVRVLLLKGMIAFSPVLYVKSVFFKIVPVSILAFSLPLLVFMVPVPISFWRVVLVTAVSVPGTLCIASVLGLSKEERVFVLGKLKLLKNKFQKAY
jgi:hypothetical protein